MNKSISRHFNAKKHAPLCLLTCLLSHSLYAQDTSTQHPGNALPAVALLDEVVAIGTKTESTIRENPYSVKSVSFMKQTTWANI